MSLSSHLSIAALPVNRWPLVENNLHVSCNLSQVNLVLNTLYRECHMWPQEAGSEEISGFTLTVTSSYSYQTTLMAPRHIPPRLASLLLCFWRGSNIAPDFRSLGWETAVFAIPTLSNPQNVSFMMFWPHAWPGTFWSLTRDSALPNPESKQYRLLVPLWILNLDIATLRNEMQMRKVGIKKFCPKPTGSPLHKAKHIRTQTIFDLFSHGKEEGSFLVWRGKGRGRRKDFLVWLLKSMPQSDNLY